jgi:hypothetical protein
MLNWANNWHKKDTYELGFNTNTKETHGHNQNKPMENIRHKTP